MHDKESELRQNSPDEAYWERRERLNLLYSNGLITENELRIGLGGKSIGVAGDRFASEDINSDRPQFD